MAEQVFKNWAPRLREVGLEPRPIAPGSKACREKNWTKSDAELGDEVLEMHLEKFPCYGVGLRLGTPLPDGTFLGALDVDRNEYVGVSRTLLGDPPCGRFGSKGIAYFVRYGPNVETTRYRIKGDDPHKFGQVAELLCEGSLLVIPPTLHPSTSEPYRWVGAPIHEVGLSTLPLIGGAS